MQRILVKKPGQQPEVISVKEVTLEVMQAQVGGYIECFFQGPEHSAIYCNEDGKLKHMEPNLHLPGDVVVGPVLITGGDEDGESLGLTDAGIAFWTQWLKEHSL